MRECEHAASAGCFPSIEAPSDVGAETDRRLSALVAQSAAHLQLRITAVGRRSVRTHDLSLFLFLMLSIAINGGEEALMEVVLFSVDYLWDVSVIGPSGRSSIRCSARTTTPRTSDMSIRSRRNARNGPKPPRCPKWYSSRWPACRCTTPPATWPSSAVKTTCFLISRTYVYISAFVSRSITATILATAAAATIGRLAFERRQRDVEAPGGGGGGVGGRKFGVAARSSGVGRAGPPASR